MTTDDSWNLVYAYTREQAIADGVLVDVTEQAKVIGFSIHTVVTDHLQSAHQSPFPLFLLKPVFLQNI